MWEEVARGNPTAKYSGWGRELTATNKPLPLGGLVESSELRARICEVGRNNKASLLADAPLASQTSGRVPVSTLVNTILRGLTCWPLKSALLATCGNFTRDATAICSWR